MKKKRLFFVVLIVFLVLVLSACSANSTSKNKPAVANRGTEGGAGGEGGGGGEGSGGGEGASGPTLTNPGTLPAAPETGNSSLSQMGEERMVKVNAPNDSFGILFADTWTQSAGSTPNSVRSTQKDWYAEAEAIPANGQTPEQAAQALDDSQASQAPGYTRLAMQSGNIHGLPAISLIYQYEAGSNPVTGKANRFIASQVFIGGGPADQLGHVTFSAPYAFYGDLSEVFDKILSGFTWK